MDLTVHFTPKGAANAPTPLGGRGMSRSRLISIAVGGVIGGYCETGNVMIATPPSSMNRIPMTFASTGRSMKNLANMNDARGSGLEVRGGRSGLDRYFVAGSRVHKAVDDDAIWIGTSALPSSAV